MHLEVFEFEIDACPWFATSIRQAQASSSRSCAKPTGWFSRKGETPVEVIREVDVVTGYTLTDDTYVVRPRNVRRCTPRPTARELPWSVAHWRISDPDGRPVADLGTRHPHLHRE